MPINTTYQFVTAGDYVDFFVNNNLQFKLSKDSNVICWYFDDQPGIVFKVNGGTYFTGQPEDISFDGVPLGSKEGFVTAIKAMFPVYAGGAGSTPGIDDILAEGQQLTENRSLNIADKNLVIEGTTGFIILSAIGGEFADNAAALAGGVPSGAFYVTTDGTERIVKQAHD